MTTNPSPTVFLTASLTTYLTKKNLYLSSYCFSKLPTRLFFIIFIQLTFFISISYAEESDYNLPPNSSLNISGGTDSASNKNSQIQLNLELKDYQQIAIGYGKARSNTATLNMTQRFVSVGTNPYKKFSINTSYNVWGKTNALETRSVKSELNLNLFDWSISLSPQLNIVTFYGLNNKQKFDLYAKAATLTVSYFGIEDYFFNLSYYQNNYADSPFFLTSTTLLEVSARISQTAQILIGSLEKTNTSISIGKFFYLSSQWRHGLKINGGSISLDLAHSSASFSNITTNFASLYADITINKNIGLYLSSSIQNSNYDNSTLTALDFGISYNW